MPAEFSDLYTLSAIDKDIDKARKIYSYSMALLIWPLAIFSIVAIGAIAIWIAIAKAIEEEDLILFVDALDECKSEIAAERQRAYQEQVSR